MSNRDDDEKERVQLLVCGLKRVQPELDCSFKAGYETSISVVPSCSHGRASNVDDLVDT